MRSIGQNPTSGTLGVQRRKDIYALCVKYDILIIEDDPYWYLQYPSANPSSLAARGTPTSTDAQPGERNYNSPKSSGFDFLDSLVPSYLSVDTQGRVIRLDTFSKTIAPGCRLGWITAQPLLVERILRITETSTQQPSGFVQSLVAQLIIGPQPQDAGSHGDGEGWQVTGWVRWLEGLRGAYERRMQTMCRILEDGSQLVKTGRRPSMSAEWGVVDKVPMYTFTWPLAGMFVWVRLHLSTHPLYGATGHAKLSHALWVFLTTEPYRVLVAPGTIFCPTEAIAAEKGWMFYRLCFAAVDEADVRRTSERFVNGCRDFWRKKDLGDIEESIRVGVEEGCVPQ